MGFKCSSLPKNNTFVWKSVQTAVHFQFRHTNETSALGTSVCCAVLFECLRTHVVDFS